MVFSGNHVCKRKSDSLEFVCYPKAWATKPKQKEAGKKIAQGKTIKKPLGYRIAGAIDKIISPGTQAALENPILAATVPFLAPLVLLSGCGRTAPQDQKLDSGLKTDGTVISKVDSMPKDSRIPDLQSSDTSILCPNPKPVWLYKLQGKNAGGNKVATDKNGNSYAVGSIISGTLPAMALVSKFDTNGKVLWQNSFTANNDNKNTSGKDISLDQSGNVLVAGEVEMSPNNFVPFVSKFNSNESPIWSLIIDNANMSNNGIALTPDDSIYLTGGFQGSLPNSSDILINKIDKNGKYLWNKLYDHANSNDRGEAIASDSQGNLYITGVVSSTYPQDDVFIGKFNPSGNKIWTKTYGTSDWDSGFGIAVDKTGNVYVTGEMGTGGSTGADFWAAKHDPNGKLLWQDGFPNSPNGLKRGYGIAVDNSSNVFLTGVKFYPDFKQANPFIKKYNPSGKSLWELPIGGLGVLSAGKGISVDNQGHLLVTGAADIDNAKKSATLWIGKFFDCP